MAGQVRKWEVVMGATRYPAEDVNIQLDLNKHNSATVVIDSYIGNNVPVSIECNGEVAFTNCYVESSEHNRQDQKWDLILVEYSKKLYSVYCYSPAVKGLFKNNIIIRSSDRNTGTKTTIADYITAITSASKYNHSNITINVTDVSGVGSMTSVPGLGTPLPDMTISHMSIGNALRTFIVDTLDMVIWYTYISATSFTLNYGLVRDSIILDYSPGNEYIISTLLKEDSTKTPVSGICIKNEDGTVHGNAGTPVTGLTQMYAMTGSFSENELNAIAAKYLAQYATPRMTYTVVFEPGTVRFKEGDVFNGFGDQTITPVMAWHDASSDPWQIQSVRMNMDATTVEVSNTA